MKGLQKWLWTGLLAAAASMAFSQVRFNEIFVNPPLGGSGGDNGREFIELISDTPNYAMTDLWIVIIEGDGALVAGTIDKALPLGTFSTGANRLFLWRDAAIDLIPAPDPATTIYVEDFDPDIENGANTYLIVRGFTGSVGLDLDSDNDSILDFQPWTEVLSAVGWQDGNTGRLYAAQLGGVEFLQNGSFTPDAYILLPNGTHFVSDISVPSEAELFGPFNVDPVRQRPQGTLTADCRLTPGRSNTEVCPEPNNPGDVNGDGCVDDIDLLAVLFAFGATGPDLPEDLTGDGMVDDADLLEVLFNFGSGC